MNERANPSQNEIWRHLRIFSAHPLQKERKDPTARRKIFENFPK